MYGCSRTATDVVRSIFFRVCRSGHRPDIFCCGDESVTDNTMNRKAILSNGFDTQMCTFTMKEKGVRTKLLLLVSCLWIMSYERFDGEWQLANGQLVFGVEPRF